MRPAPDAAGPRVPSTSLARHLGLAGRALGSWGPRQWGTAAGASLAVAAVIGFVTVLVPNPVFGRDVAPVAWNYLVWPLVSVLTGLLLATYVRPAGDVAEEGALAEGGALAGEDTGNAEESPRQRRAGRLGAVGAFTAWFAVGCPVCNKIALLVLGYSGAMTYFAPIQPWLGAAAVVASVVALVARLSGQMACPTPVR